MNLTPRAGTTQFIKNYEGAIKYSTLHMRVKARLGKAQKCTRCKSTSAQKYEWANKSGKYFEDKEDWLELCCSCHKLYDHALYFGYNLAVERICCSCRIIKPLTEFYNDRSKSNGKERRCKSCKILKDLKRQGAGYFREQAKRHYRKMTPAQKSEQVRKHALWRFRTGRTRSTKYV